MSSLLQNKYEQRKRYMVSGRPPIDPHILSDVCSCCGIRINYNAAKPAASGLSKCPACVKLVYFEKFLQYEVSAKLRKFSHKEGVSTWLRQKKTEGLRTLGEFVR